MSNICWPRRPDLCDKDGRDCRKLEERRFKFTQDGKDVGWLFVTGDFGFKLTGLDVEELT